MAKSIYGKTKAEVAFNMTPMIDCTFQLIIFFMLVTQMVSADYVQMKLPDPDRNRTKDLEEQNKVIVNVVPYGRNAAKRYDGKSMEYKIRTTKIARGDTERLTRLLQQARQRAVKKGRNEAEKRKIGEEFAVEIRADRSMHYLEVLPVLEAVQAAEIEKMRITTLKGKRGGVRP